MLNWVNIINYISIQNQFKCEYNLAIWCLGYNLEVWILKSLLVGVVIIKQAKNHIR